MFLKISKEGWNLYDEWLSSYNFFFIYLFFLYGDQLGLGCIWAEV